MRSPALSLFMTVLESWGTDGWGLSWVRLNGALSEAVRLAISSGLRFDPEDFRAMQKASKYHIPGEVDHYHREACRHGNKSAADSIDTYRHRKAIKLGPRWPHKPDRHHLRRVFVGYRWEEWTVTSFADDGESVIACSYEPYPDHTKVRGRRTFDRAFFSPPKPDVPHA